MVLKAKNVKNQLNQRSSVTMYYKPDSLAQPHE